MHQTKEIDFDRWVELARQDPDAFEVQRRETIAAVIADAPSRCQERLQRLQWRIDQVRARSSNPLAACISLSDMMWKSLVGQRGLLGALRQLDEPPLEWEREVQAKVLPFRPRTDS